jgi:plastocyanin
MHRQEGDQGNKAVRPLVVIAAAAIMACEGGGDDVTQPMSVARVLMNPADQQSISIGGSVSLSAQPKDAQGNDLSRAITWSTANPARVLISSTTGTTITATGLAGGWSIVTATSDGQSGRVMVEVKFPNWAAVMARTDTIVSEVTNWFSPAIVNIAAGGTVTWTFGAVLHDVTFRAPKPPEGDISARRNTTASRTFPTPGAYQYTCTIHGPWMSGTVNVY